jgi:hypothetical protein
MAVIVVTGMARGGTTFAAKVIGEATDRPTHPEILNPSDRRVPKGVLPYQADPPMPYLERRFKKAIELNSILKDPFLAPYVTTIRAHWTNQVIAMVRHPAAVANSFVRVGWWPRTDHLPIPQHEERHLRLAALYQYIYSGLVADKVPIFRAEDLANKPITTMMKMLMALGEEGDITVASKYLDPSFGTDLGRGQHKFRRSPAAMDNWKRTPMLIHLKAILREAPIAQTWY